MSMYFTTLPRPNIGDVYVRYREGGEYEEALAVSIMVRGGDDWTATIVCNQAFDFVTGSPERRAFEAWFPRGWVLDEVSQSFRPPNTKWSDSEHDFVAAPELGETPMMPTSAGNPYVPIPMNRPIPGLDTLFDPHPGEHYMAWFGRIRRTNPSVDYEDVNVKQALKARWRTRGGVTGEDGSVATTPA